MFEVVFVKETIERLKARAIDDIIDKAHYLLTCTLLLVCCFIISSKQIFGEQISCINPSQFPKQWSTYVNSYCFVTGTYVMENSHHIMNTEEVSPTDPLRIDVSYYQWVPLVLAFQAMFFYAPHMFWFLFQKTQTDIDFKHLVGKCMKCRGMPLKKRHEEIDDLVQDMVKTYEHRRVRENASGLGSLGAIGYFASKFLNILNVIAQLYLLNIFIGRSGWGIEVIRNALAGVYWDHTGFFPRISLCTFKKNALMNVQPHTVQCVLMMNMLNEKIFALLYVWLIILLVASVINAFYTLVRYVSAPGQRHAVRRFLKAQGDKERVDWRRFAELQLEHDGLLLLRFIENNAGLLIASEVACKFYDSLRKPVASIEKKSHSVPDAPKRMILTVDKENHDDQEVQPLYPSMDQKTNVDDSKV